MITISDREVQLETADEAWAKESYDELLNEGWSCLQAYEITLSDFEANKLSDDFWAWLLDKT